MKISKQTRREAKELFRGCLANGLIDEAAVRKAVKLLIEKKPRGFLATLSHLQRLVRLEIERKKAAIESAAPLSAELQTQVRENLTKIYGPGLSLSFTENDRLLGGLRVQVGSDVYDGSVRTRLAQLEQSF